MKYLFYKSLLSGAIAVCLASAAAQAAGPNSFYAPGDLVLFFQKEGDTNTVYANLGNAATVFRGSAAGAADGVNQTNFLNINATLTSAFGADWASDPQVYVGLAGVFSTNSSNSIVTNGDPSRTLYVSAARQDVGSIGQASSAGYTVNTDTGMSSGANTILAQNNVFEVNYDVRSVVSPSSVSQIDNQNPFLVPGQQGTAFNIFGSGVQQVGTAGTFGTFGDAGSVEFALDLYRITAKTVAGQVASTPRTGSYEGTVTVNGSGMVSFVAQGAAPVVVAPLITTQPLPVTINSGATTSFTVAASGTSPTFQWYLGTSGNTANPAPGATATTATYTTPALSTTTSYWVRAHNSAGDVDSNAATATVITAPLITTQPLPVTINSGATTSFTVAASGTSPTFQWYLGTSGNTANPAPGATATTATYTTPALSTTTSYWVRAHNSAGDVDSNAATATVRSSFDSWMIAYPSITTGADLLSTADPDKDGVINLLEFVLNGNPSVSSTAILPTLTVTATHFIFSFNRRDDSESSTTLVFQYGSNLTGWTDAPIGASSAIVGDASIAITQNTTTDAITVTVPKTVAPGGNLFGRLKVSQP